MIVQAIDGNYYKNPVLVFKKWMLQVSDDGVYIHKTGSSTWNTARKHAIRGGVKSRIVQAHGEREIVLESRLVHCSVFEVQLKGPIPVPTGHDGVFTDDTVDMISESQETLKWPSRTGNTSTRTGEQS